MPESHKMNSDLMGAAGEWICLNKRVVTKSLQHLKPRYAFLSLPVHNHGSRIPGRFHERKANHAVVLFQYTLDDRIVSLADFSFLELLAEVDLGLHASGKQNNAARIFVQAMHNANVRMLPRHLLAKIFPEHILDGRKMTVPSVRHNQ